MADEDLVVVGMAWFSPEAVSKLTTARVIQACKTACFPRPPKANLTESLKYFAEKLIETEKVQCKKTVGLCRKDVIIKKN